MRFLLSVLACILVAAPGGTRAQNVVEKLDQLGLATLVDYIDIAGLTEVFQGLGPFTVFAPTNDAFDELPDILRLFLELNPEAMAQVLGSHVVFDVITAGDIENDQVEETLGEVTVRLNLYGDVVTVNGVPVSSADQEATNGVIHVVDSVLFPFAAINIFDALYADPNYELLATLLELTGLDAVLSTDGPYTLFAPEDLAFDNIPDGALEDLIENPEKLFDVLTYHVIPGTLYSAGLSDGDQLTTLQGQNITVSIQDGTVSVNGAEVFYADYACTNGAIHSIDGVLLPDLS